MIPELQEFKLGLHAQDGDGPWHSHGSLQFFSVVGGEIDVQFPGFQRNLHQHDFVLIADGHLHMVNGLKGTRNYMGFLSLSDPPQYFSGAADEMSDFGWLRAYSYIVPNAKQIGRWMEEVESYWVSDRPARKLISQGLMLRVFERLRELDPVRIPRDTVDSTSLSDHKVFHSVLRVIESMYQDPHVKVKDIARVCAISPSLLYKVFNEHLGYGPKRYLQLYRVDRARELLHSMGTPISDVAKLTGFPDVYAFSRVFKRLAGQSPSEFRNPRKSG